MVLQQQCSEYHISDIIQLALEAVETCVSELPLRVNVDDDTVAAVVSLHAVLVGAFAVAVGISDVGGVLSGATWGWICSGQNLRRSRGSGRGGDRGGTSVVALEMDAAAPLHAHARLVCGSNRPLKSISSSYSALRPNGSLFATTWSFGKEGSPPKNL
ncbi:hypothetical protein GN958_ATG01862 [Phytophthora infestans]|uniref:Uncharacterized protein n=1 Tax=Phytophthora infestans TaxID=4787 RepID=A0A8S9V603_PHYIN|nr:hypothetical protein GN958_ATG01862 [Phytophthora infestans]